MCLLLNGISGRLLQWVARRDPLSIHSDDRGLGEGSEWTPGALVNPDSLPEPTPTHPLLLGFRDPIPRCRWLSSGPWSVEGGFGAPRLDQARRTDVSAIFTRRCSSSSSMLQQR